jgi:transcriptional regulator with XRE-family HTH domain
VENQTLSKKIGSLYRRIRLKKGMTQDAVARLSGVNRTYLPKIEEGETEISVEVLFHICSALEVSLWKFLRWVDVEIESGKLTWRERKNLDPTRSRGRENLTIQSEEPKRRERVLASHLGSLIRRKRLKDSLSQIALSKRSGIHRTYIGTIEEGGTDVSVGVLNRICNALDIKMWAFLKAVEIEIKLNILTIPEQAPLPIGRKSVWASVPPSQGRKDERK